MSHRNSEHKNAQIQILVKKNQVFCLDTCSILALAPLASKKLTKWGLKISEGHLPFSSFWKLRGALANVIENQSVWLMPDFSILIFQKMEHSALNFLHVDNNIQVDEVIQWIIKSGLKFLFDFFIDWNRLAFQAQMSSFWKLLNQIWSIFHQFPNKKLLHSGQNYTFPGHSISYKFPKFIKIK